MFMFSVLKSTSKRILKLVPLLILVAIICYSPIQVGAQDAGMQRANRASTLAAMKSRGWRVFVCHIPIDTKKHTFCLRLGTLSKLVPEQAIAIGEWMRDHAERWAATHPVLIPTGKELEVLLNQSKFAGCSGQLSDRGADVLVIRNPLPTTRINNVEGMSISQACSNPMTTSPVSHAMGIAYTDIMDGVEFLDSYGRRDDACGSQYRGGSPGTGVIINSMQEDQGDTDDPPPPPPPTTDPPPPPPDPPTDPPADKDKNEKKISLYDRIVGRAWFWVADKAGTLDKEWQEELSAPNVGVGVRGYCIVDMECASSECGKGAGTQALADMMFNRYGPQACEPAATPSPDSGSACFRIRKGGKITPEMQQQLAQEFCEFRQKFYGEVEGGSRCPLLNKPAPKRPVNICADPRAMCTPDNGGIRPSNTSSPRPRPLPIPTKPPGTR